MCSYIAMKGVHRSNTNRSADHRVLLREREGFFLHYDAREGALEGLSDLGEEVGDEGEHRRSRHRARSNTEARGALTKNVGASGKLSFHIGDVRSSGVS